MVNYPGASAGVVHWCSSSIALKLAPARTAHPTELSRFLIQLTLALCYACLSLAPLCLGRWTDYAWPYGRLGPMVGDMYADKRRHQGKAIQRRTRI
jgi:hypothetical protein